MTTPQDQQVHRLRDMQVEEVSLVDRAANKRKYLVVKRDTKTMATGAALTQGPNGQLTVQQQAAAGGAPPAAPAAGGAPAPAAGGDVTKDIVKLTGDAKNALAQAVAEVEALISAAKNQISGAQEVSSPDEQSVDELLESLSKASDLLEDSAWALIGVDPEDENSFSNDPDGQHDSPPPAPAPDGMASMTMGKRLELLKARRVITLADVTKAVRATVEKIGAKMTKTRQARLRQAMKLLGGVLKEVMTRKEGPQAPGAGQPPPGQPPKKKPPQPGGVAAPTSEPPAGTSTKPVGKSEEVTQLQSQVADLAKKLKMSEEEKAALRKSIPGSNATQPGTQADQPAGGGQEFSWPTDMNYEIEGKNSPDRF